MDQHTRRPRCTAEILAIHQELMTYLSDDHVTLRKIPEDQWVRTAYGILSQLRPTYRYQ